MALGHQHSKGGAPSRLLLCSLTSLGLLVLPECPLSAPHDHSALLTGSCGDLLDPVGRSLTFHLKTIIRLGADGVLNHGLQILGCLMLLSVLIWASKSEPNPVRPLLAYPPHNRDTVLVHVAGLLTGALLMLR